MNQVELSSCEPLRTGSDIETVGPTAIGRSTPVRNRQWRIPGGIMAVPEAKRCGDSPKIEERSAGVDDEFAQLRVVSVSAHLRAAKHGERSGIGDCGPGEFQFSQRSHANVWSSQPTALQLSDATPSAAKEVLHLMAASRLSIEASQ